VSRASRAALASAASAALTATTKSGSCRRPSAVGLLSLWSKPSADGAYLAFSEVDRESAEGTLQVLDLRSGQTRSLLTQPIKTLSYPVLTVIGWVDGND
jgi:hypothetical protein